LIEVVHRVEWKLDTKVSEAVLPPSSGLNPQITHPAPTYRITSEVTSFVHFSHCIDMSVWMKQEINRKPKSKEPIRAFSLIISEPIYKLSWNLVWTSRHWLPDISTCQYLSAVIPTWRP